MPETLSDYIRQAKAQARERGLCITASCVGCPQEVIERCMALVREVMPAEMAEGFADRRKEQKRRERERSTARRRLAGIPVGTRGTSSPG